MNSNDLTLQSSNALPIIEFQNVTKKFSFQSHKTFKEFLPALIKGESTKNMFTALDNISFSVNRGETIGIIGPNGSGKSTILKLIAGVMTPTSGTVTVNGNVSPLIELGAGMHPELSGKENVYLNGTILGLNKKQIDNQYKEIVDFAELWEFIYQPIKRYSSGMYMRLAFSIAIHVKPEILLVDEILAVGDTDFQAKCFAKMTEFQKDSSVTILFVSHSLAQIQSFCSKAIYLNHSKLINYGPSPEVCQQYINDHT